MSKLFIYYRNRKWTLQPIGRYLSTKLVRSRKLSQNTFSFPMHKPMSPINGENFLAIKNHGGQKSSLSTGGVRLKTVTKNEISHTLIYEAFSSGDQTSSRRSKFNKCLEKAGKIQISELFLLNVLPLILIYTISVHTEIIIESHVFSNSGCFLTSC